jgi:hypothetical protein
MRTRHPPRQRSREPCVGQSLHARPRCDGKRGSAGLACADARWDAAPGPTHLCGSFRPHPVESDARKPRLCAWVRGSRFTFALLASQCPPLPCGSTVALRSLPVRATGSAARTRCFSARAAPKCVQRTSPRRLQVVVNDLGGSVAGQGADARPAERVVAEIRALGGEAVANFDSVEDGDAIVKTGACTRAFPRRSRRRLWPRRHRDQQCRHPARRLVRQDERRRLVSVRAQPLRRDLIQRVHVRGAYKVTRAAWPHMQKQGCVACIPHAPATAAW